MNPLSWATVGLGAAILLGILAAVALFRAVLLASRERDGVER